MSTFTSLFISPINRLTAAFGIMLILFGTTSVADPLKTAIDSPGRTPAFAARDGARHPYETLSFFQVEPDMAVVEIWPGGGWYTEILAPYLAAEGHLYAAHFSPTAEHPYFLKSLEAFKGRLSDEAQFADVELVVFDPANGVLGVPPGSADRVLTFRNVHNWLRNDAEQAAFDLFYKALKPGGVLGVVEHRSKPGVDRETMLNSGYMDEQAVVDLATRAGFVLDARTDINANPEDSADHPAGVWTLPPTLRLGDEDKDRYLAIGESDRMTLRFVKPRDSAGSDD